MGCPCLLFGAWTTLLKALWYEWNRSTTESSTMSRKGTYTPVANAASINMSKSHISRNLAVQQLHYSNALLSLTDLSYGSYTQSLPMLFLAFVMDPVHVLNLFGSSFSPFPCFSNCANLAPLFLIVDPNSFVLKRDTMEALAAPITDEVFLPADIDPGFNGVVNALGVTRVSVLSFSSPALEKERSKSG
ncbi:hypothetical protein L202_01605 [Cryptococcus amylolentus CBS 6039]|uniref:Uncharacterized protein n=1 Tax=Cryptococcus amylolentus CBS 6039 TaxID=1295533 RepID=A0A1E3I4N5_9TREE|nr:hypothetical protein L202_01605 [Cryptococcus amylolentus CBS 6039]ODN83468.1 hypothetical protein L202_01605 [Cryptococcus amylolentus CBS 6039]